MESTHGPLRPRELQESGPHAVGLSELIDHIMANAKDASVASTLRLFCVNAGASYKVCGACRHQLLPLPGPVSNTYPRAVEPRERSVCARHVDPWCEQRMTSGRCAASDVV